MKPKTLAPAAEPSAVEAAALVASIKADIAGLENQIATAESERNAKALELGDDAFEAHVLEVERKKRSLLRLKAQSQAAEAQHAEAKAREKEEKRRSLYEAGLGAEAEVERLVGVYTKRAAAVVETLREIATHAETIRIADDNRASYAHRLDSYGLRIGGSVVLPAAIDGAGFIWNHGEPPPPPKPYIPQPVFANGRWIFSGDEEYAAAVAAKSRPSITPVSHQPAPQEAQKYGERTLPDGTRKITLPPNEWPPKPDPVPSRHTEDGRTIITPNGF